ncbi:MAG TPA: 2Fe-2S iron-sulfur cluster-binding protein [Gallionellaceae bacterium]
MGRMLSMVRAARLVGVSRSTLQKKVQSGELESFDGMIDSGQLLRCYPEAELEDTAELMRVMQIKERAFGKRVFERALPDAEVLAARVTELGKTLERNQAQLGNLQALLAHLYARLDDLERQQNEGAQTDWNALRTWIRSEADAAIEPGFSNPLEVKERLLSIMSAHVTVLPGKQEFLVEGQDTLLEAAIRAGIPLNYGCSGGNCGLCKARVVSGQVIKTRHHDYVIPEAEKERGCILLCSNTAVSDMVIEAAAAHGVQDVPFQQINTRVKAITPLSDDFMLLHLETPRSQRLRFFAGQKVNLQVSSAYSADLPIASCPCDDRNLMFHVRRQPGNYFSDYVFHQLRRNDMVRIEGPQGEFVLHEGAPRKLYFFAFDNGFAPVKSLIEQALALDAGNIQLHWFGSHHSGIYMPNVPRAWADALDNFGYAEHMAAFDLRALNAKRRETLNGWLKDIVDHDPDVREGNLYIAGPEEVADAAEQFFLALGLPGSRISTGKIN